jgi:hypothetical protein
MRSIFYPNYFTGVLNSYSITKHTLEHYEIIAPYTNIATNYVLYPLLMEIVKHKVAVLVILAFI